MMCVVAMYLTEQTKQPLYANAHTHSHTEYTDKTTSSVTTPVSVLCTMIRAHETTTLTLTHSCACALSHTHTHTLGALCRTARSRIYDVCRFVCGCVCVFITVKPTNIKRSKSTAIDAIFIYHCSRTHQNTLASTNTRTHTHTHTS